MKKSEQRQNDILAFMKKTIAAKGYSPTVREICAALEIKSTSTVHSDIKALEDKGWTQLEAVLSGPTALVAGDGDPAEVAKAIVAFLKKNEQASVKAGQLESQTLDAAQVKQLSELPGKDEMRAKLLGTLNAPAQNMVGVLAASLRSVLYVLKARVDKEGGAA